MDAVFAQLADFPWFVESADREQIERLLSAPIVPTDSFVVRPCASRKALAISYKAARLGEKAGAFELVHTRVRLDPRQQMWSVDNSNRHFPTISKLVQSLRLTPLSRPLPVAIRVDVEPLKLVDEIVFVDAKWTVRQFLDHVVAHLYTDLARDTLSLVRADSLAVLADSAALLDASVASNNVRFLVKRLQPAAPAPAGLYTQLPPVVQIGKPIYDIIPSLNDAIDRPAANANATAGATTTASAASSSSAVAADVRRRPDLPAKSGVEFTAPAAAAVVRAAIANRSSNDIDNNNNNNINVDDVAEPEKVRIVSGAFFEDLLSDLNAIEFEAAAAKRESGQFDVAAGFDALLNDAELCGDIEIDTQTIQTKKLNTLFDLIDEEDEAAAGTS